MRWITLAALAAALECACPGDARGQDTARAELSRWIFPGSEVENYLRYLQTLGLVKDYSWSVRAFSSDELRNLASRTEDHPWANARELRGRPLLYKGVRAEVAPVEATTWYNTAFPFGMNDGAVWVGRGLTAQVSAGASAAWGPVELTLAPTAFWAENRSFPLAPNAGASPFGDAVYSTSVDRPQRFGNSAYSRVDPGQSSLRVSLPGVALGISTANEWWGPMSDFPFLLGNNAPGFAHVFIGSSRPVNVLVGRVHGRVLYGSLDQSAYSPDTTTNGRRFGAGIVATFEPRGFPGLEVGATRFFHVAWPDSGLTSRYFTHLFESFLKQGIGKVFLPVPVGSKTSADNQLASAFARWVMPRSGFEVYGEYGREDHNVDTRDLLLEPDHASSYGVGVRKAWRAGPSLIAVRAEIMNFQTSTLARHRSEESFYKHTFVLQGHTNRGQLLGAAIGVGSGAGSRVAVERFDRDGSMSAAWSRLVVQDRNGIGVRGTDVQHVLRVQRRVNLRGSSMQLHSAVDGVYELNRNATRDQLNVRVEVGSSWYR